VRTVSIVNKFGNVASSGVETLYGFTCHGAFVFTIRPMSLRNKREDNIKMDGECIPDSCNSGQGQVAGKRKLPRAYHIVVPE